MNDIYCMEVSQVKSLSLMEIRDLFRDRINWLSFTGWERKRANELCLIIAEEYKKPDGLYEKINGELLPVELVQEVFMELDERHISSVLESFEKITYKISNPRAYLRTALYNSVFELVSKNENESNVRAENA